MGEVVDRYNVIVFHSEFPHVPVPSKFIGGINVDVILFHGLAVGIIPLPDFTVAVVEKGVVFGFREEGLGSRRAHF